MVKKKLKRQYKSTPKEKPAFSSIIWQTHEFVKPEIQPMWYILIAIATIIALFLLIWFKHYALIASVFVVLILIAVEMVIEPRLVRVEINEFEIKFGEKIFQYSKIKSYSIVKMHEKKHLLLHTTQSMMALVDIPLGKQTEDEIKIFLDKRIPYVHLTSHPRDKFVFWR